MRIIKIKKTSIRTLFILDSIGAAISALFLGVVIPYFDQYFKMPLTILYQLATIAVVFCLYSMVCALLNPKGLHNYLKGIAFGNLVYAFITITLVIYHTEVLTVYDFIYFFGEVILLITLTRYEFVNTLKSTNISPFKSRN